MTVGPATDHGLPPTELVPWQVGFAVGDIDDAVRTFSAIGVGPWCTSEWRTSRYFDPFQQQIIEPRSRVAFGKLSATMAIELIQADPDAGPIPRPWQISEVGGPTHIGFWSGDVEASALELARRGVSLAIAKVTGELELRRYDVAGRSIELPVPLDTSYYASDGGPMVELIPDRVWSERLPALLGESLAAIVAPPPTRS